MTTDTAIAAKQTLLKMSKIKREVQAKGSDLGDTALSEPQIVTAMDELEIAIADVSAQLTVKIASVEGEPEELMQHAIAHIQLQVVARAVNVLMGTYGLTKYDL